MKLRSISLLFLTIAILFVGCFSASTRHNKEQYRLYILLSNIVGLPVGGNNIYTYKKYLALDSFVMSDFFGFAEIAFFKMKTVDLSKNTSIYFSSSHKLTDEMKDRIKYDSTLTDLIFTDFKIVGKKYFYNRQTIHIHIMDTKQDQVFILLNKKLGGDKLISGDSYFWFHHICDSLFTNFDNLNIKGFKMDTKNANYEDRAATKHFTSKSDRITPQMTIEIQSGKVVYKDFIIEGDMGKKKINNHPIKLIGVKSLF
jgi:hypothetical protein